MMRWRRCIFLAMFFVLMANQCAAGTPAARLNTTRLFKHVASTIRPINVALPPGATRSAICPHLRVGTGCVNANTPRQQTHQQHHHHQHQHHQHQHHPHQHHHRHQHHLHHLCKNGTSAISVTIVIKRARRLVIRVVPMVTGGAKALRQNKLHSSPPPNQQMFWLTTQQGR